MLDWRLDRETWDEPTAPLEPAQPRSHPWLRRVLIVLALGVLIAGAVVWKYYTEGAARLRADVQRSVDLETWVWQRGDAEVYATLLDATADPQWLNGQRESIQTARGSTDSPSTAIVEDVDLRGDVALATIRLAYPGNDPPPARQMRFYRRVEGRWLQTAPVPSFWGAERDLETKYFRLRFRERDEEAVKTLAGRIDEFYEHVNSDFGVTGNVSSKVTVEVVPATFAMLSPPRRDRLRVPSPELNAVPVNDSPADILAWEVGSAVVDMAANQVVLRDLALRSPRADRIKHAMSRWEVRTRLRPRSQWGSDPEQTAALKARLAAGNLPVLADFDRYVAADAGLADTLVDYIARRYGARRFADVLRVLRQQWPLQETIPRVLGVNLADFEQGWHQYLEEIYRR